MEMTNGTTPTADKGMWTLPFGLTNRLVALLALAKGGLVEEANAQAAAAAAFDKGFVDYSVILLAVKNGQRSAPPREPNGRGASTYQGHQQNSFRGRGQGFRGRYRGKRP